MDLNEFLKQQTARPTEQLDEGAREFIQGVASSVAKLLAPLLNPLKQFASSIVGSVKRVFFKTVTGKSGEKTYPVYEKDAPSGTEFGYMYPDAVLKASGKNGGSARATFMKVFIPNKLLGNAIKIAIDPQFLTNSSRSNSMSGKTYADLPANESFVGKLASELLNETPKNLTQYASKAFQKETAFSKKLDATYNSTDIGIPDPQAFIDNEQLGEYISSAKIEVQHLADILSEFLYTLSWRKNYSQPVPSLLLLGFPGGGKTSLINSFGRGRFQTHVLEIASIYKEVLGGFPVVEDIYKDPELLKKFDEHVSKLKGKAELTGETTFTGEDGKVRTKEVRMKAADLFPSEDGKVHIFFMDEYNRDAEKMAAAMNLMLSGSIGTQYHLPRKTIVIASGNLGENIDKVKVAKLDSATFDRYDAKVLLSRNMQRALEFSRADTTYGDEKDGISRSLPSELRLDAIEAVDEKKIEKYKINMGGLVSSIDIWANTMIEKYGPEWMDGKWEQDLSKKPLESEYQKSADIADDEEMSYQITPRTIDKINTRLKNRAMRDWIEAKEGISDLATPREIEKYFLKNETTARYMNCEKPEDWERVWEQNRDEYLGRGIPSPTALYLHIMQWHEAYLPTVLRQIFGGSPKKMINSVRQTAYQAVKDANQVTINDIIFGYVPKKIFGHDLIIKDPDGTERKQTLNRASFMNLVASVNTMKDQVMRNLVDVVSKNSSNTMMEKMIEKTVGHTYAECVEKIKEGGANVADPKQLIILNIAVFMKDTNLTEARAASFIRRLKEFGILVNTETGKTTEGEADAGVDATKAAKEAVAFIYSGLWQISDVIKNTRFIQSGGSVDEMDDEPDTEPAESGADTPAKRGRGRPKKTTNLSGVDNEIEEGLKSLFKKML